MCYRRQHNHTKDELDIEFILLIRLKKTELKTILNLKTVIVWMGNLQHTSFRYCHVADIFKLWPHILIRLEIKPRFSFPRVLISWGTLI